VLAYGFSAGGYLATRLAARGDVKAAVSVAGIYYLDSWARRSRFPPLSWRLLGIDTAIGRQSRRPRPTRRSAPHLMLHGNRDQTSPFIDAPVYDRRAPRARLVIMRNFQHEMPAHYVRPARRWLVRWVR
jgi:pimeloyl-ACP methyl ester carboxylesterase